MVRPEGGCVYLRPPRLPPPPPKLRPLLCPPVLKEPLEREGVLLTRELLPVVRELLPMVRELLPVVRELLPVVFSVRSERLLLVLPKLRPLREVLLLPVVREGR